MSNLTQDRLEELFQRFPHFLPTITRLDAAKIPYAIGGSGCLYLLGNERFPGNINIYLPNDAHDAADDLFGGLTSMITEKDRTSDPSGDGTVEFVSRLKIIADGRWYDFSIMPRPSETDVPTLALLPPEDILLMKAINQRGPDVGKHDLEDVHAFMKVYPNLNRVYLKSRIESLGAAERVGDIFAD